MLYKKTRYFNPINAGKKGLTWKELNPSFIFIATLMSVTNDCLHAISHNKQSIYDSNLASAIKLSKDSLDWCSHTGNNNVEYSEFSGFKRTIELNPISGTEKKEA